MLNYLNSILLIIFAISSAWFLIQRTLLFFDNRKLAALEKRNREFSALQQVNNANQHLDL
ncbi:MAG: hypothetical protein FWG68_03300 [Defluviitaleaceae bacterium]|nr:hypothetical protein [Defluviitaleaceae bacterium]